MTVWMTLTILAPDPSVLCFVTPHTPAALHLPTPAQIADTHWGVIMVQYRPVRCDTWSSALPASNPTLPDFPSVGEAQGRKDDLDWWKYFPKGGLTSHRDGQVYQISTDDFLKKIGKE